MLEKDLQGNTVSVLANNNNSNIIIIETPQVPTRTHTWVLHNK
jgi:hypothetical protein